MGAELKVLANYSHQLRKPAVGKTGDELYSRCFEGFKDFASRQLRQLISLRFGDSSIDGGKGQFLHA